MFIKDLSVILFSYSKKIPWFWHQGDAGLTESAGRRSLLSSFLEVSGEVMVSLP